MVETILESSYPQRSSTVADRLEAISQIEPLHLSETEREDLKSFEENLYLRYTEAMSPQVITHTIYPEAFTTPEGSTLFSDAYLPDKPRMGDVTVDDIVRLFDEVDLSQVPKDVREKANSYSSEWAREKFSEDFKNANGDISLVANPERVTKILRPENLKKRIKGLRELKLHLKDELRATREGQDPIVEARRIVLDLYRRRVNVSIASTYEDSRILGNGDEIDSRDIERIDHFLNGVGTRISKNGLLEIIPEDLRNYAEGRVRETPDPETEIYQTYNPITVDSEQARSLGELILKEYGIEGRWRVVIKEGRLVLGVSRPEIRIPKNYEGGLIDTLKVLSHEIEGHVLRYENKQNAMNGTLELLENKSSGRGDVLSEGAAMWVEGETQNLISGMSRDANPYYYLAILTKREGGDFRECFAVVAKEYAKRRYGRSLEDVLKDADRYQKLVEYVYPRILRIFRRNTPLNDRSGYVPASDTLDYLEQELVVGKLMAKRGEDDSYRLLFLAGVDLYSYADLKRLGMVNLTKVEEPKMVAAKIIWPRIKKGIDEGKSLQDILSE